MCTLLFYLITTFFTISNAQYNVVDYGAKGDGKTDSTQAFLKAWYAACASANPSTVYVPTGIFLIKNIELKGPCKAKIEFRNDGNIVAPNDYTIIANMECWILFRQVNSVTVDGSGTVDAKGFRLWNCKKSGKKRPFGANSICFSYCNDVSISGVTSINSQVQHWSLDHCNNVNIRNVKIRASSDSPNTDGIQMNACVGLTISSSVIMTGDDCISISQGSKNIWIEHIECGPGHGVSIGSLGDTPVEEGVQNVTVTDSIFTKTQNGLRIKAWARPSNGFARDIVFQNINMRSAYNPIIIDENYCPSGGCPQQSSAVKISQVSYKNIKGISGSQIAMSFNCSSTTPCTDIRLEDIDLKIPNMQALSYCNNVQGSSSNVVSPKGCI